MPEATKECELIGKNDFLAPKNILSVLQMEKNWVKNRFKLWFEFFSPKIRERFRAFWVFVHTRNANLARKTKGQIIFFKGAKQNNALSPVWKMKITFYISPFSNS